MIPYMRYGPPDLEVWTPELWRLGSYEALYPHLGEADRAKAWKARMKHDDATLMALLERHCPDDSRVTSYPGTL